MTFRSRLASASGIPRTSLMRVNLPASRCPTPLSLGRRSPTASSPLPSPAADDRPGSIPRRILLATPAAEIPSGVRLALRIRSISASCMRTSMPHPCYERMNHTWYVRRNAPVTTFSIERGTGGKFFPRLPGIHSSPAGACALQTPCRAGPGVRDPSWRLRRRGASTPSGGPVCLALHDARSEKRTRVREDHSVVEVRPFSARSELPA
jgi:hypothetical protein